MSAEPQMFAVYKGNASLEGNYYSTSLHPNLVQILAKFPENQQNKMRINVHFHPLRYGNITCWAH